MHKILATTEKINADDVKAHFDKILEKEPDEIEKVLPKNSKLLVFCGYHGILDTKVRNSSKMGEETDKGFFNDIKTSLMDAEEQKKFKDLNICLSGDMRQVSIMIGKTMKQSVKSVTDTIFEDLQPGKRPRILFLASCFSEFSDFKDFLQESGVCAVIALKNDRGIITKGKCLKLDKNQARVIEEFKDDHQKAEKIEDLKFRNLFISGPYGCGKTVILVEVCWMRIYFCLRMIQELLEQAEQDGHSQNYEKVNVRIYTDKDEKIGYRKRGAESLLEEFKNKYFAPTLLPRNSGRIDFKFLQLDDRDKETSRIDYMNQKIESISTKEGKDALNIIMIDEMCPSPNANSAPKENANTGGLEHDWSDLKCNQENVFLLLAFNPCSTFSPSTRNSTKGQKFKIKTPGIAKDSHSKHEQLQKIYRCTPSIAKFADFIRILDSTGCVNSICYTLKSQMAN